jgi:hypothetical protein
LPESKGGAAAPPFFFVREPALCPRNIIASDAAAGPQARTEEIAMNPISRRDLIRSAAAMPLLAIAGAGTATAPLRYPPMTMYRDPGCGCCLNWAALARRSGFNVTVIESGDMASIKRRLGVPPQLASCHTASIGNYVIEGHVPLNQVAALVSRRPRAIRGLAVPGMPVGSPGMEVPDGSREPFQVLAFNAAGQVVTLR